MQSRDKLLAEKADLEKALPDLKSGAVYVGNRGDGQHEAYLARVQARLAELRELLR